jgi:hypothetical protein
VHSFCGDTKQKSFSAKTAIRAQMVSLPHAWIHARQSDHLRGVTSNIHQQKTSFLLMDI